MIITAVLARVTPEGHRVASRKARGKLKERLGDSKAMVAHGDVALGEAWARALVMRGAGRAPFAGGSPDDLIHAIALDDRAALRAPCPPETAPQCWSTAHDAFVAGDDLVAEVSRDLDALANKGVSVVAVRSVILCARRMNEGQGGGKNKFVLDLHAMERLVLDLVREAGGEALSVCGKVGGFGKYSSAFGPLGGRLHAVLEESRARSAYHFPGVGEIAFVRDADANDLVVGMASMVGKYLREMLMGRVVAHYRSRDASLPDASGYYDPVTTTFIDATKLVRAADRTPDTCFERRGAEPA